MKVVKLIVALSLFLFVSTQVIAGDAISKSVEAVFKEKTELKGKQVVITGKVVKVNNGIMKRNFLHIQDGTGGMDTNNLIITSNDTAKVGDQVVVTGTVALDTDFGFGYKYPLLVENSSVKPK